MLAILLGAFAAHFLLADRGYVLVNFRGYVVEMSVPGLVIVLVAGVSVRARARGASSTRRAVWRAAREQRLLVRRDSDLTAGAHAAHRRQLGAQRAAADAGARSTPMRRSRTTCSPRTRRSCKAPPSAATNGSSSRKGSPPDGATSALLTRAELQLGAGEPTPPSRRCKRSSSEKGDQPAAIALLARAYRALGRSRAAARAAAAPRSRAAAAPPSAKRSRSSACKASSRARISPRAPRRGVGQRPERAARRSGARRASAHGRSHRLGRGDEAERELRAALKRDWHPPLVLAYGEVRGADLAKQLKQVETWLKTYPEDAALLLAAARLSMANELWGKARSYLESSLALAPTADAYALYGRLLTRARRGRPCARARFARACSS